MSRACPTDLAARNAEPIDELQFKRTKLNSFSLSLFKQSKKPSSSKDQLLNREPVQSILRPFF